MMSSPADAVRLMTKGDGAKQQQQQKRRRRKEDATSTTTVVVAAAVPPLIDNRLIPNPLQVRPGEPCSITVSISGQPPPAVRWQIGRRRVKESTKYQLTTTDVGGGLGGHTLVIARATEDLEEQGVWVVASNEHGEDCCHIEVKASRPLNEDEMASRRNRRPPVASTPEMKQKTSILRKKKTRRVGETQSVVSLDAWTTGNTAGSSNRPPSVDDVTTAPDNSFVATPSDLNQSLDSEQTILSRRRGKRTGSKPSRFSSTDAIYSGGTPLSLTTGGRQDSYSSVTTIDVMAPETDRRADDSVSQGTGSEILPVEETAMTTTKKIKKSSVRKKKTSGSRSSLASSNDVDASNVKNMEATNNTEETIIGEPVKTIESEEKTSSAKEMVGSSIPPLEPAEDGKLLWELFGMRLNQLCRKLLTDLQSNLDTARHNEKTETVVSSVVDGDQSPEHAPIEGNSLEQEQRAHPQYQHQQQQRETSVDDEEEIIRRMVENRQIPVTDLDDFDRGDVEEEEEEEEEEDDDDDDEEPPILVKAQQIETNVDDDFEERNPPTGAGDEKDSGWKAAPVQKPKDDDTTPDSRSRTGPAEEKVQTNGVIPSIAIYDVQGSMVEPSANEAQKRKLDKENPQQRNLEKAQHKTKETEKIEPYEMKQENVGDIKEPNAKEPEKREPFRKEQMKKESEIKEPFSREQYTREPLRKEPEKKEPQMKEAEGKEPERKEPFRKEQAKRESEIQVPYSREPYARVSFGKEPEKTEQVIKESETKESLRKSQDKSESEIKESFSREPYAKEPVGKEPEKTASKDKGPFRNDPQVRGPFGKELEKRVQFNKELQKKEPETKEPLRKEPETKEPDKREQFKKEPEKKDSAIKEPFSREPYTKEPVRKEQEKKEPDKKESKVRELSRKESANKESQTKEPFRKEPEKEEPVKIEPVIKVSELKGPIKKELEKKEPEKKEPDKEKPVRKEPEIKDSMIKGQIRKEPEKKEQERKEPVTKVSELKGPTRKEPEKKEPEKKETVIKVSELKGPTRKEPEKKEPVITVSELKGPSRKEPERKEPEKKEPVIKEPVIKEPEKTCEPARKESAIKESVRKELQQREAEKSEPLKKEVAKSKSGPDKDKAIEHKLKDRHLHEVFSALKPSTPLQPKPSPASETKDDKGRIQQKPPTGKKPTTSPDDDLRATKVVVHPGNRPVPTPRKLSLTGGSDSDHRTSAEHLRDGAEQTEEAPPVSAPRSPVERDEGRHNGGGGGGGDRISYSWQRDRTGKRNPPPPPPRPDSNHKSTSSADSNNCPIVLTTYILHSGTKSRQTPSPPVGERPAANKDLDGNDGNSLKASRSTPASKTAVPTSDADTNRQRPAPAAAAAAPIVPERAGRKTADRGSNEVTTQRQRSQSADRVDSGRKMIVVDIDIDDQQDNNNSKAGGLYRASSNLYRSSSGDLSTSQDITAHPSEDIPRRPPVPKPRQRVSLKPARSEESLATKSSAGSGGTNKVDGSDRRFLLRAAKSVESLQSATGSDSSFVSRMGRRTMSQEWQVVTVTTTTEEVVVVERGNDKKESKQRITDLVSKEVKGGQTTKNKQRTDLVSKEVKGGQTTENKQRTDLASKEVKGGQTTENKQRITDLVSKEVKGGQTTENKQRTDLVSKEVKDGKKIEKPPVNTASDQARDIVKEKDEQKESNKEISHSFVEQKPIEIKKETKDNDDLRQRPSEAIRENEKQNEEQLVSAIEMKPTQHSEDTNIIGFEEQPKQEIKDTGSQVDDSQSLQEDKQMHIRQVSRDIVEYTPTRVQDAETGTEKAVAANDDPFPEMVSTPTYITSATIFLKSPKLSGESVKPPRYLDTAQKSPTRPRLSSQDTSTQTDEDQTEAETQIQTTSSSTNTDLNDKATTSVRHKDEEEMNGKTSSPPSADSEPEQHICSAVVYEYGEILSFYLDTGSGLNDVEPPTPDLVSIRLEPGEPVTALVTDNRNVIVLTHATDRDNEEKDNIDTTELLNSNLETDDQRSKVTIEGNEDRRRPPPPLPHPTTINSGNNDSTHGLEPDESFIALRSSKQQLLLHSHMKETKNTEHDHRFQDSSAAINILLALSRSTARVQASENQSTNRPLSDTRSIVPDEIGGTDGGEVPPQVDEHHVISIHAAASGDEIDEDPSSSSDQSDEESHQSSVSSAPSCDTVIRVAIRDSSAETPTEEKLNCDYFQSAIPASSLPTSSLPASSLHQSDGDMTITSQGDDTDDDDMAELDSAIVTLQQDNRIQSQDRIKQNDEDEELGAVGGIAIGGTAAATAFKEHESDGPWWRDDEARGAEAWPRRHSPFRSRGEQTDEVMDEKTFVQCALSSLGTIIFLAVTAIIFHFLNNIVGDQLE